VADIDFKALADAALNRAEQLLALWLPDGRKVGGEWKALNPMRSDDSRVGSFSISLTKGIWRDFASGDSGADLVSLYAYLFHAGEQAAAARALAIELGMPEAAPPPGKGKARSTAKKTEKPALEPKEKKPGWRCVMPVPDDAPAPPKAHEFRGIPVATWAYQDAAGRLLGYVCRFAASDGGKDIIPLTYRQHETTGKFAWRWMIWPDPRPLYGLDRLAANPDATVLIVEGEKCRDAAQAELPSLVVLTWPGGVNAVAQADWSALAGRKVMTWADADSKRKKLTKAESEAGHDPLAQPYLPAEVQPGAKAMAEVRSILHGLGCQLWNIDIPPPGEAPDGWDVADAVTEGLAGDALADWMRDRCQPWQPPAPAEEPPPAAEAGAGGKKKREKPAPAEDEAWRDKLLWKKGELDDCLANVYDILANRREWRGVVAFDEFSMRTVKLKPPPYAGGAVGEWDSADDSRTAIWLTRQEWITPSSARVAEAVETVAKANPVHPVRAWLQALPAHDGVSRIDHWLTDYLGVKDSPYVRLVARFYLLGMVARVMKPGVKFDYCLVLEGKQGKGKSSALRVLGGEWYADTDLDLHNKDSMSALQGVWLYEFAELGSVARAEATKQKSFLSRQVDKYRPVYGRRDIQAPRQVVFAGSTNDWEWNKDPTGGRRFWPVECADTINLDGLAGAREQLFAEALALYQAGERFWPTPEEQQTLFDPEQLMREQPESLVDALHDWVYAQVADFSVAMAVMEGLKLPANALTRDLQTRVGIACRKLGCTRVEKRNGMVRYWYKPPARNGASSQSAGQPSPLSRPPQGGHDAPF
jgi:putative DNA primase/helicase